MGLASQYEDVASMAARYWSLDRAIQLRFLRPVTLVRVIVRLILSAIRKTDTGSRPGLPSRLRRSLVERQMIPLMATDAERESQLFPLVVSEYPIEALADYIAQEYPGSQYSKLVEVHRLRAVAVNLRSITRVAGAVFAVGAIFFRSVPRAVVEQLSWDYSSYQLWTFWITAAAVALVVYFLLLDRPLERRRHLKHEFIRDVLRFLAAKFGDRTPN